MKAQIEYVENSTINVEIKSLDFFAEKLREWKKEKDRLNIEKLTGGNHGKNKT